jgi:uncharacterized membrane protein
MELHPVIVHFPVALVVVVLLFDWGRWIFARERLLEAGFWGGSSPLLIVALIGACVSVATGLIAESGAPKNEAISELIESHEMAAFIVTGGLALLALWRISLRGMFPRRWPILYLLLLTAVTVVIGYGAYLGGIMVYGHGAGVRMIP